MLIATLVLWTAIVHLFAVPAFLLPGPLEVLGRVAFLYENAKLLRHIGVTLSEIVAGFVLGTLVGILAGVVFTRLPRVERLATPFILLLQTAPKIAIAPLLLLWLGIGPMPKIVLIAIVTFFPVMAGMVTGLCYGEGSFRDLAAVLKLSAWQRFWHIELPSALPAVNGWLNGVSAVLLAAGWILVRRRRLAAHRACMLGAFCVSVLFLLSYVTYHAVAGSRPFTGQGWTRWVYFPLLVTHVVLAAAMVPFVLTTLYRALSADFARHVRLGRVTLPVWLYVSVTGVLVYCMLYLWFPAG